MYEALISSTQNALMNENTAISLAEMSCRGLYFLDPVISSADPVRRVTSLRQDGTMTNDYDAGARHNYNKST